MEKKMILDVNESPKSKSQLFILSLQHILAMFVACITVPLIVGTPIPATIVSAGIGTLIYIFFTQMKSPVVLSSSFAYLSTMQFAFALGRTEESGGNYLALALGMLVVGLIYVIVALVIKKTGTNWLFKLLPTIVVGPVIMVIGLGLAGSAVNNLNGTASGDYNLLKILCGLIAMIVTAFASHSKKSNISLIPFVLGMGAGYLAALLLTVFGYYIGNNSYFLIIDFSPIVDCFKEISLKSFISYDSFAFLKFNNGTFHVSQILSIVIAFAPVAFVTICEHIGDHLNLSGILGKDLFTDPGLTRTLLGDGIATAVSGGLSGCANTTYGENVAVVGVTKIASVKVIVVASIMTVILGFIAPVMSLVQTIPACVTGGVSLILYGFIASSGVKMLINDRVDLSSNRNIFIASAILVSGIGGLAITIPLGEGLTPITITSTAVALIIGIVLNLILPKDAPKQE